MWTRKSLKRGARSSIHFNYLRMVAMCIIIAFFTGESDNMLSLVRFNTWNINPNAAVRMEIENMRGDTEEDQTAQDNLQGEESYLGDGSLSEESPSSKEDASLEDIVSDENAGIYGSAGFHEKSNSQVVREFLAQLGYRGSETPQSAATKGVFAAVFNSITETGSITFGILNMVNQMLFHDSIGASFIILLGGSIIFLYRIFIGNILVVGKNRFFLETVTYEHAPVHRILFIYKVKRTRKTALTMFMKNLFQTLWMFTIVGGIYKYYSYYMIPYIVAENPDLPFKEVFRLSKQMTKGRKWKIFLFDLSFLGWEILSVLTAGLLSVFLVVPYRNASRAELYRELREETILLKKPGYRGLNDRYLFHEPEKIPDETPADKIDAELRMVEYPTRLFTIPETEWRDWMETDYNRSYSLLSYVLFFFAFAMIGWFWEVVLHIIQTGDIVNRGVLYGPWLPIYGCGGVLILFFMRRFAKRPVVTFFLIIFVCGVLEYGTAWILEIFLGTKWWDYSGFFLNLHGRICAEGLLIFGVGGCAILYIIAPILDELFSRVPKKIRTIVAVVLIVCFAADTAYSFLCQPNTGKGITEEMEADPLAESGMISETYGAVESGR